MKFLNPIVAPYIQPLFNKVVTYFWGPEAIQADSTCPIRPRAKKTTGPVASSSSSSDMDISGDGSKSQTPITTTGSKSKDD